MTTNIFDYKTVRCRICNKYTIENKEYPKGTFYGIGRQMKAHLASHFEGGYRDKETDAIEYTKWFEGVEEPRREEGYYNEDGSFSTDRDISAEPSDDFMLEESGAF